MRLTRREWLAGLAATAVLPGRAAAEAPARSLRPLARGAGPADVAAPAAGELLRRSGMNGAVAFALADPATGEMLETHNPVLPLPPASTAKALTALYAMDTLGASHRFTTRLLADGPVRDGRIEGDLILAGGGDPALDTDALMEMAKRLKAAGIREVGGTLKVWTGALPVLHEIDAEQPDHVGYNPAICGLNLNYNRVRFGWTREKDSYEVTMDARSGGAIPGVQVARMEVVDRKGPIYTYQSASDYDAWTVARAALGSGGARWLPVRRPGLYAGEVFQTLARSHGIQCHGPIGRVEEPRGDVLVARQSEPLVSLLRQMLKYSTNLTAEVLGMSAGLRHADGIDTLAGSADRMNGWLKDEIGLRRVALEDHSGLGDDSRVTAVDMARAMRWSGPDGALRPLLKPFTVEDKRFSVEAKTGTLNFVSALTGFVSGPAGQPLAFAILCADLPRRDALSVAERERPPGAARWNGAARWLQRALLERWGQTYLT